MLALSRSSRARRRPEEGGQIAPTDLVEADAVPVTGVFGSRVGPTVSLQDELTGLGSIFSLRKLLEPIVDQFPPFGARPALLLIDLDRFRQVNSLYGQEVGDEVLRCTAARLRRFLPYEGATYRIGDDEFVALLDPMTMIDAVDVAGRIQAALSEAVVLEGANVRVSASVAVVMFGQRQRADGLLRDADVTMYRAKAEGGNRVDLYNWEVDSWATARKRDYDRLSREVEELRLQNRTLIQAITLDPLTAMPNAVAFEADQLQLHARWKRSGEPYVVVRARIDDLDETLPQLRSSQGSETLTAVAHAIRDAVRQADRAYLLGEGEFAVLLPGSGVKQSVTAAERLRSRVERLAVAHPADPARVLTVTVALVEVGFRHSDVKDVIEEVNGLLRSATAEGGNRVVWPH